MNNKPDIVEKLEFTDEEYLNAQIQGIPYPSIIKHWEKMGYDIKHKTKWYSPPPPKERLRRLSQKYRVGLCHRCHSFPSIRLTWKLDGISLVEYWCNSCYEKRKGDNQ
jgi:hypothetical protein